MTGIVNSMIDEAKQKHTKSTSQPKKPLIRLRVSYQNEDYAFNEIRFGQQYNDLVGATLFVCHQFIKFLRVQISLFRSKGGKSNGNG